MPASCRDVAVESGRFNDVLLQVHHKRRVASGHLYEPRKGIFDDALDVEVKRKDVLDAEGVGEELLRDANAVDLLKLRRTYPSQKARRFKEAV